MRRLLGRLDRRSPRFNLRGKSYGGNGAKSSRLERRGVYGTRDATERKRAMALRGFGVGKPKREFLRDEVVDFGSFAQRLVGRVARESQMKSQICLLLLIASGFRCVRADGIPVNHTTGRVIVPHTVLNLSESQSEEIDTLGTLTLSADQWKKVRAVTPECPKQFYIVPVTSIDPAPEDQFYGIQLSGSQVAVADGMSAEVNFVGETLYVDRHGQFYCAGVLIPYRTLIEKYAATSGKTGNKDPLAPQERELVVNLPFGVSKDSTVIKDRLDRLFKVAAASGWRTPDD